MATTSTTWVCPHLGPEDWSLVLKALAYAAKYSKQDSHMHDELVWLQERLGAVRDTNLRRRIALRDATRRFRARRREQRIGMTA